jgi:hypothetical protein
MPRRRENKMSAQERLSPQLSTKLYDAHSLTSLTDSGGTRYEGAIYAGQEQVNLAFDLRSEWQRAQELGGDYRRTFVDNAHFYAGETYIGHKAVLFEYDVDTDGRLKFPGSHIDALESFKNPLRDPNRPGWLKNRDAKDLAIVSKICADIKKGDTDGVWVASSPAISDNEISPSEKEKYGYGRHNFLLVHQLQRDSTTGAQKLLCRALRNNMSSKSQRRFMSFLTGRNMSEDFELHGHVDKIARHNITTDFLVQNSIHIAYLHSMGQEVAKSAGEHYWSSTEQQDYEQDEEKIMQDISKFDWWLEDIYNDICRLGMNPKQAHLTAIENKFRGWEKAVQLISRGEKFDDLSHSPEYLVDPISAQTHSLRLVDPRVWFIQNALTWVGGVGTCGQGSGFGMMMPNMSLVDGVAQIQFGLYTFLHTTPHIYTRETARTETTTHYESYTCPHAGCGKLLSGEPKKGKWRDVCDHCGKNIKCKK